MIKVEMTKHRFIATIDMLYAILSNQSYALENVFKYFLKRNIALHNIDHQECKFLWESYRQDIPKEYDEFISKREALLDTGKNIVEDEKFKQEMLDLIAEYKDAIMDYDVNRNTCSAFLNCPAEYEFIPIPFQYIPVNMLTEEFEFIYPFIENGDRIIERFKND